MDQNCLYSHSGSILEKNSSKKMILKKKSVYCKKNEKKPCIQIIKQVCIHTLSLDKLGEIQHV